MTYRQVWVACPSIILTELGIDGASAATPGWLKFYAEVATINHNWLGEATVKGGFGRGISAPMARQRGYEITVRESRYSHYLALDRLAALSDSAVANNQTTQLITIRDYSAPNYDSYVAAIAGNTSPFTDRVGYIPRSSIKIAATVSGCELGDLRSVQPIQFQFVESVPSL